MKIRFYGAARTVTGSMHFLEINGQKLLLECGIFQGRRRDFYERNCCFPFDPKDVDAVILSHAHIDHSGNLPNLVKQGYENPIYATPPTADLSRIMLRDSGHIYEEDTNYFNKKKRKHGQPMVEPLYTVRDAEKVDGLFHEVTYNQSFQPVQGVTARLVDAGHILGSAAVVLDITEGGQTQRLWFSGDIGRNDLPLLRDPVLPSDTDILLMECTYGDKAHADIQDAYDEFREVVLRTVERGGKVIIPSFAVGRTQEIVYCLNRMIASEELPPIPVFVDSPLAINATEIFMKYPDYYDAEAHEFVSRHKHPALEFPGLRYTRSVEESKAINRSDKPWQAPHTLGRRLAEHQKSVRIFGDPVKVRADIATIGGLSAHGGQKMLLEYAAAANENGLKDVFLVHGSEKGAKPLMEKMRAMGIDHVSYPERGDTAEY
jgi:metallo-beta-lactamase family protein